MKIGGKYIPGGTVQGPMLVAVGDSDCPEDIILPGALKGLLPASEVVKHVTAHDPEKARVIFTTDEVAEVLKSHGKG